MTSIWDETPLARVVRLYDDYSDVFLEADESGDEHVTDPGRRARLAELCDQIADIFEDEAVDRRRMADTWRTPPS